MSIEIMNQVWKSAPVDQGTLLVLLALADSADERTRTCYPGIESLAAKARLSERQVQYCLQRLREIGVIQVVRNASPVKTNLYRITDVAVWDEARDAIIAPHGTRPDTQSATGRDEVDCVSDTQLVAPEPSVTSDNEPSDLFGSIEPHRETVSSKKNKPSSKEIIDQGFDQFWKAYPQKGDKRRTKQLYAQVIKSKEVTHDELMGRLAAYLASDTVKRGFLQGSTRFFDSETWRNFAPIAATTPTSRIEDLLKQAQIEDALNNPVAAERFRQEARKLGWQG
jgi:hypothetical protein